jgi:hypothetical protein
MIPLPCNGSDDSGDGSMAYQKKICPSKVEIQMI